MKTCQECIESKRAVLINCNKPANFWYMSHITDTIIVRCDKHKLDLNVNPTFKLISFEEALIVSIVSE